MHTVCDKDQVFFAKRITEGGSVTNTAKDGTETIHKLRHHDRVRQNAEELDKLNRIERELHESEDLRLVQKHQDIVDFEADTNKEFNKKYELSILSSN